MPVVCVVAVSCPDNSDGDSVVAGCMCNAGYSGSVTVSTVSPFFSSSCTGKLPVHMHS